VAKALGLCKNLLILRNKIPLICRNLHIMKEIGLLGPPVDGTNSIPVSFMGLIRSIDFIRFVGLISVIGSVPEH
jgi:hypothetical protein